MFLIRGTVKPEIIIQVLTLPILMKLKSFKKEASLNIVSTQNMAPKKLVLSLQYVTIWSL